MLAFRNKAVSSANLVCSRNVGSYVARMNRFTFCIYIYDTINYLGDKEKEVP